MRKFFSLFPMAVAQFGCGPCRFMNPKQMNEKEMIKIELPLLQVKFKSNAIPCLFDDTCKSDRFGKVLVNDHCWHIDYCEKHDYWWVNPRPSGEYYNALYSEYFYKSPIPEQLGYASLELEGERRASKAVKNWSDIEKNISLKTKKNLLEVGCATGEFLIEAQNRGWKNIEGIEYENQCASIASKKGLNVFNGSIENYYVQWKNDPIKFDMVFADNVIEHVFNPLEFLNIISEVLDDSGILVLRLPDTQPYGPTLKLLDHTYHFKRKSMTALIEKGGFKGEIFFHSGTFYGSNYPAKPHDLIENMTVIASKYIKK